MTLDVMRYPGSAFLAVHVAAVATFGVACLLLLLVALGTVSKPDTSVSTTAKPFRCEAGEGPVPTGMYFSVKRLKRDDVRMSVKMVFITRETNVPMIRVTKAGVREDGVPPVIKSKYWNVLPYRGLASSTSTSEAEW